METKQKKHIGLIILLLFLALALLAFSLFGGFESLKKLYRQLKSFDYIDDEELREAFEEMSKNNPDAEAFCDNFKGITDYDLTLDVSEDDAFRAGDPVPYFTQWDARWGYCKYSSGLIGWTGCGPTALSMVAMGLTGDGTLTPAYMADLSSREGYCVKGSGTSWTFFTEGAAPVGLTARELPLWEATMRSELEAGHPIICVMGPGYFTTTGHYIVLTGCDEEGFFVLDPFRPSNNRTYSYDELSPEIKNLWSYSLK